MNGFVEKDNAGDCSSTLYRLGKFRMVSMLVTILKYE